MPVVFGPTLRRLAGSDEESDSDSDEPVLSRQASPPDEASDESGGPVTPRRIALGALVAGVVAWLAARRGRRPRIEPPF